MSIGERTRPPEAAGDRAPQDRRPTDGRRGSTWWLPVVAKVGGLGLAIGIAASITPVLVLQQKWLFLVVVWLLVAALVATYATGRARPVKYLLPGTLFLLVFVVFAIILTVQLSTTNFGDGARASKEQTVARIINQSFEQTAGTPSYNLTVATEGNVVTGPFVFFLTDPDTGETTLGTTDGLSPAGDVTVEDGYVTEAPGYTLLTPTEVNAAGDDVRETVVPAGGGAEIRPVGVQHAVQGTAQLVYDPQADTITDAESGTVYSLTQIGDRAFYVSPEGDRVSDESWQESVGLSNYERIFTDPRISQDFLSIFVWTVVFATLSVLTTFALGLFLAITFNDPRVRGQKYYRALLILPYAVPGFISLLIWSSFFNTDFGLINELTGLSVDWFGNTTMARVALVLTNLWMGFPYMFLVCTGALQAIPADLKEAASIDGASGFYGFRKITFPLLLVAVAPLLVATFAFNFNNFNAIQLLTEGGPFDPANPTAGGTDILITYTIRLAFGAGGQQIGFASAVSVVLFILTGVIAAIQFRATRSLEEVH
jgi:arabinogalactan oligomer/maltooligosaccharide transport system permease protein